MKKHNKDYIMIPISIEELIAIRECLEMIFEKYSDVDKERERIAVLDFVFKHEYSSQLAIYIYEQIYDKIVKVNVSIFDTELPDLKLTKTELELLYIIAQSIFGIDDFVQTLKNYAKWSYYDNNLALLLKMPDSEKTYKLSDKNPF